MKETTIAKATATVQEQATAKPAKKKATPSIWDLLPTGSMLKALEERAQLVKAGRPVEALKREDFKAAENNCFTAYVNAVKDYQEALYNGHLKGKAQANRDVRFVAVLQALGLTAEQCDIVKKACGNHSQLISVVYKSNDLTEIAKAKISVVRAEYTEKVKPIEAHKVELAEKPLTDTLQAEIDKLDNELETLKEKLIEAIESIKAEEGAYKSAKYGNIKPAAFRHQVEYFIYSTLYDIERYQSFDGQRKAVDLSSQQWGRKLKRAKELGVPTNLVDDCKRTGDLQTLKALVKKYETMQPDKVCNSLKK